MKNRYLKILVLVLLVFLGAWLIFKFAGDRTMPENQNSLISTAPVSESAATTVVVYGDMRTGHNVHRQIVEQIVKVKPRDVFLVGDLVEDGDNPEHWDIFNNIIAPLKEIATLYPAAGNHDKESALYYDNFSLPGNEKWYSVDITNAHFIVLNSNLDLRPGSEQYSWLESDLRVNQGKSKFQIILMHHPLPEILAGEESDLTKLFSDYQVDLVFFGHTHNYQRFYQNNIYYIITGGGAAPLYDLTVNRAEKAVKTYEFCELLIGEEAININVLDEDSRAVDNLVIKKKS